MSTNHYRECPRCRQRAARDKLLAQKKTQESYGKVPAEEYDRLLAESRKKIPLRDILREDYQLGVGTDGVFAVNYRCRCSECNFTYSYQHREVVSLHLGEEAP